MKAVKNAVKRVMHDTIDPEEYEFRHRRHVREAYLYVHWRPLIFRLVKRFSREKNMLDLGCGTGSYLKVASKVSKEHVGLDLSENMLRYAKNKSGLRNLVLADARKIPVRDNSFDFVLSIGLLEYVYEKEAILREINRILKAGGIAIIAVPNRFSAFRLPIRFYHTFRGRQYPLIEPTHKEMLRLIEASNLKLVSFVMDDGLVFLPDKLDEKIGYKVYSVVEKLWKPFRMNPFSNVILYILSKD